MQDSNERYRDLWGAVLAQAYIDLDYKHTDRNTKYRNYQTENVQEKARRFLKGDSRDFHSVCFMAGVEPDRARKFAQKKLEGVA